MGPIIATDGLTRSAGVRIIVQFHEGVFERTGDFYGLQSAQIRSSHSVSRELSAYADPGENIVG